MASTIKGIARQNMAKSFAGSINGWEIYIFNYILQIIPPYSDQIKITLPFNCEGYPTFNETMNCETGTCQGIYANSFYTLDVSLNVYTDNCEIVLYQNQNMIPLIHIYSVPIKVGEALHTLGNGFIPKHTPIGMCLADEFTGSAASKYIKSDDSDSGYSSSEDSSCSRKFSDTEY